MGAGATMGKREIALKYLYTEQRKAKISLGRAENRPNVDDSEILNLNAKLAAIDWLIPLALAAKEESDEKKPHYPEIS